MEWLDKSTKGRQQLTNNKQEKGKETEADNILNELI